MALIVTVEEPGSIDALGLRDSAPVAVVGAGEGDSGAEPMRDVEPMLLPSLALPAIDLPLRPVSALRLPAVSVTAPEVDTVPTVGTAPAVTPDNATEPATPVTTAAATVAPTTSTPTTTAAPPTTVTPAVDTVASPSPAPEPPEPSPVRAGAGVGPMPQPIAVPGGPVQFGFNVDLWGADRVNYWNALEAVPGNGRLIAHEFKSFTKDINTELYQWHLSQGRDLLLTWNGTDATSILNGSHDQWIREHARELGSLSDTIMLRFWHEPDVAYKADWIDEDPQNFIDSWMYVRQIFLEEGTTNIEWVWCPTAWNWEQQGARFYPGDANVDWICADGYSGFNLDRPLEPIANEFAAFQAWADQRPNKPILIAEFGATARGPGDRAEWVRGIPDWVAASPNIRAVVYFDFDKRAEQPWDWRLRTEPDAWNAVLDVLSSAPFGN